MMAFWIYHVFLCSQNSCSRRFVCTPSHCFLFCSRSLTVRKCSPGVRHAVSDVPYTKKHLRLIASITIICGRIKKKRTSNLQERARKNLNKHKLEKVSFGISTHTNNFDHQLFSNCCVYSPTVSKHQQNTASFFVVVWPEETLDLSATCRRTPASLS